MVGESSVRIESGEQVKGCMLLYNLAHLPLPLGIHKLSLALVICICVSTYTPMVMYERPSSCLVLGYVSLVRAVNTISLRKQCLHVCTPCTYVLVAFPTCCPQRSRQTSLE